MRVELFPQQGVRYPGRRRAYYIRIVADNGETLATSEAYASGRWGARRAARKTFPGLEIKEVPS